MEETPLKVIFLADTRPGHYHLAQGVIAALARLRPVEVTRIEVKRKWIVPTRWLRRRIHAKTFFPPRMLRMAYRIDAYALPKADLGAWRKLSFVPAGAFAFIALIKVNHVDVRAEIEFTAAEFAHTKNNETIALLCSRQV